MTKKVYLETLKKCTGSISFTLLGSFIQLKVAPILKLLKNLKICQK